MSKPAPLEWSLSHWKIECRTDGFDVGIDGPDPVSWRVTICWEIKGTELVEPKIDQKSFRTYQEVVDYIYKETGLMYEGMNTPTNKEDTE